MAKVVIAYGLHRDERPYTLRLARALRGLTDAPMVDAGRQNRNRFFRKLSKANGGAYVLDIHHGHSIERQIPESIELVLFSRESLDAVGIASMDAGVFDEVTLEELAGSELKLEFYRKDDGFYELSVRDYNRNSRSELAIIEREFMRSILKHRIEKTYLGLETWGYGKRLLTLAPKIARFVDMVEAI